MDGDVLVCCGVLFGIPLAILFFRWLWYNPRVNTEKLKRRLAEANALKERLAMADELLQDLDLQTMEKMNIRTKGITITWTDDYSGAEKSMTFLADGKNDSTKQLRNLAKTIRQETTKDLMKIVYKLPKRHGKNQPSNVVTIHGLD